MKIVKLFMLAAFCCAVSLFPIGSATALDDWIETIDIVSLELGSVPIIPAITLGEATLAVDPVQKLTTTWGSLKASR